MLLKEFLELNTDGVYLEIYLEGTDGCDWFYKKNIPDGFKNRKVLAWSVDNEDLVILIEGQIFADGTNRRSDG